VHDNLAALAVRQQLTPAVMERLDDALGNKPQLGELLAGGADRAAYSPTWRARM
jgi:hypothetical protein